MSSKKDGLSESGVGETCTTKRRHEKVIDPPNEGSLVPEDEIKNGSGNNRSVYELQSK